MEGPQLFRSQISQNWRECSLGQDLSKNLAEAVVEEMEILVAEVGEAMEMEAVVKKMSIIRAQFQLMKNLESKECLPKNAFYIISQVTI